MKKEDFKDNSFGVASVVFGILSIVLASLIGLLLGIIAFIFARKQIMIQPNQWSKTGKILSIIGIALSIIVLILLIVGVTTNPNLLANLQ